MYPDCTGQFPAYSPSVLRRHLEQGFQPGSLDICYLWVVDMFPVNAMANLDKLRLTT